VVKHPSSTWEALGSIPNSAKKVTVREKCAFCVQMIKEVGRGAGRRMMKRIRRKRKEEENEGEEGRRRKVDQNQSSTGILRKNVSDSGADR
jgi:hypothetical protein